MGINLLPPEIIEKRESEQRLLVIGLVSLAYIGFLILIYLLLQAKVYQENLLLTQLKAQNELLNKQIAEFKVFEERKAAVDSRREIIKQAMADEISWYKLLLEMSMILPSDLSLDSLNADTKEGIKMTGKARDYLTVAKWMVRLKELDEVADVWLEGISKGKENLYSFTMSVQLKGVGAAASAQGQATNAPPAGGESGGKK